MRLCAIAAERWAQLEYSFYQINLLKLPCHRLVNMVYAWCIERVPEDKLEDWLVELEDLMPWQSSDSSAAEALESASFMAMMAKGDG